MEKFSALLALCAGNSPVTDEFPAQKSVTQSFDFFLNCAWINGWANNREAGDLRRHRAHYDVTIKYLICWPIFSLLSSPRGYISFILTILHPHDDVIKWNHYPRYWPFVRGIHRSPVNSPHKDQWRGALMFSLICACIDRWVNNREVGDLWRYHAHYDVIVV